MPDFEAILNPQLQEVATGLVADYGEVAEETVGDGLGTLQEDRKRLKFVTDVTGEEIQEAHRALPGFYDGLSESSLGDTPLVVLSSVGFNGATLPPEGEERPKLGFWDIGGVDSETDASVRYTYRYNRFEDTEAGNGQIDHYAQGRSLGAGLTSNSIGDVRLGLNSSAIANGPQSGRFERAQAPDKAYVVAATILYVVQNKLHTASSEGAAAK